MNTRLIKKYEEPKLHGYSLLIACDPDAIRTSPDDNGWIIKTIKNDGNNPDWSTWVPIGEVRLLHSILIGHLKINPEEAESIIESVHFDGLTVQERLSMRI